MMNTKYCQCGCGATTTVFRGIPRNFIHGHNGKRHFNKRWNTGMTRMGPYLLIKDRFNPRANSGGYVFYHVKRAQEALGKGLPRNIEIHHFPKAPSDQLVICENRKYHHLLHVRYNALKQSGDPHFRKCMYCHVYDNPINLYSRKSHHWHFECAQRYLNNYRRKQKTR